MDYQDFVKKDDIYPGQDEFDEQMLEEFQFRTILKIPLNNNYKRKMIIIMMNPSKASYKESDETVRRVLNFAHKIGEYSEVTILNLISIYESNSKNIKTLRLDFIEKNSLEKYEELMADNLDVISKTIKETNTNDTDIYVATGNRLPHEGLTNMRSLYNDVLSNRPVFAFKSVRKDSTFGKKLTVQNFTYHPSRQNEKKYFSLENRFEFVIDSYDNR